MGVIRVHVSKSRSPIDPGQINVGQVSLIDDRPDALYLIAAGTLWYDRKQRTYTITGMYPPVWATVNYVQPKVQLPYLDELFPILPTARGWRIESLDLEIAVPALKGAALTNPTS
jgi:hypothetical protein